MRKRYIDILKGIGVLLVIIGHLVDYNSPLKIWIYSFHMPLFFFISGFLYKKNNKNLKLFIKKKFKSLLIPYFIFNIISLIFNPLYISNIDEVINGIFYIKSSVPWNSSLWFLPILFITNLLYYFIDHLSEKYKFISVLIILLTGIFLCYNNINLFFGLHIVPFSLIFFYIGYLFNKFDIINRVSKLEFNTYIFLFCIIMNVYLSLENGRVNMSTNLYNNYLIFIITALLGIFSFIYISIIIKKDKIIEMFGQYSLYVFCTQRILFKIFTILSDNFNCEILNRGIGKISLTVLIYLCVLIIMQLIKKRVKLS